MRLKIFASIALFTLLGLVSQARAANQGDIQKLEKTGECPRCDLSGANLTKLNLTGVNLRNANLKSANFSESNLEGADLTGANLESV